MLDIRKCQWYDFAVLAKVHSGAVYGAGAADPIEIEVNEALWGLPNLNSLKGMSVAWDEQTGQIYTAGIVSDQVRVTRPADGHPRKAIALGIQSFFNVNSML